MNTIASKVVGTDVQFPEPPSVTGAQAQGDLIILPWPAGLSDERRTDEAAQADPIAKPIVVLTGDNGHNHTLSPAPGVRWCAYKDGRQTLGVLVVDDGSVAVLGHIEHGDSHVGPGVYVIRRQREQADLVRYVAD